MRSKPEGNKEYIYVLIYSPKNLEKKQNNN
jgi:hypothetical protein